MPLVELSGAKINAAITTYDTRIGEGVVTGAGFAKRSCESKHRRSGRFIEWLNSQPDSSSAFHSLPERLRGYVMRYAGVPLKWDRTYLKDGKTDSAQKIRATRALSGRKAMVIQYDSRASVPGTHMYASILIWQHWANLHGHLARFYYGNCTDCGSIKIADAWCKVAACLQALSDNPEM